MTGPDLTEAESGRRYRYDHLGTTDPHGDVRRWNTPTRLCGGLHAPTAGAQIIYDQLVDGVRRPDARRERELKCALFSDPDWMSRSNPIGFAHRLDTITTTVLGWYSEWDEPHQRAKLARIWERHGVPEMAVSRIRELYTAQHG